MKSLSDTWTYGQQRDSNTSHSSLQVTWLGVAHPTLTFSFVVKWQCAKFCVSTPMVFCTWSLHDYHPGVLFAECKVSTPFHEQHFQADIKFVNKLLSYSIDGDLGFKRAVLDEHCDMTETLVHCSQGSIAMGIWLESSGVGGRLLAFM